MKRTLTLAVLALLGAVATLSCDGLEDIRESDAVDFGDQQLKIVEATYGADAWEYGYISVNLYLKGGFTLSFDLDSNHNGRRVDLTRPDPNNALMPQPLSYQQRAPWQKPATKDIVLEEEVRDYWMYNVSLFHESVTDGYATLAWGGEDDFLPAGRGSYLRIRYGSPDSRGRIPIDVEFRLNHVSYNLGIISSSRPVDIAGHYRSSFFTPVNVLVER